MHHRTRTVLAGFLLLLNSFLALGPDTSPAFADSPIVHVVIWGDTLSSIASRYGTTITAIMQANNLRSANRIWVGEQLEIPGSAGPSTPPSTASSYTVQRGDSLYSIASRYGVTVSGLMQANRLSGSWIYVGQSLQIPGQSTTPSLPPPSTGTTPTGDGTYYTVRRGDYLIRIAARYGTTPYAVQIANHLASPSLIFVGQRLYIPGTSSTTIDTAAPPAPPPSPPTSIPPVPPVVVDNFRGQNLFNYGVQLNWTNHDNNVEMGQVNQLGFRWAKAQVRWCDVESSKGVTDLSQLDRLMSAANANGIKVLLSVVCAPRWSRADGGAGGSGPPDNMQDAADFISSLAGNYCGRGLGAIEVWNEHNLLTEWHGKPISAALYMDMLKRSYTAIKSRCSTIVVVSGAPTPTGVTNSTAIDDVAFLQQLYANGLKNYSDAVGAHPSGFGNPPDVPAGTPNSTGQFQGHRSFYFRGTMEAYRAVMAANGDGNKQIWPTEFGWGVDDSPSPGYEYERSINVDQQADWLVKAYQWMKISQYTGVAFVWNLDFMDMNNETGAFHILGRPAFDHLAGMTK